MPRPVIKITNNSDVKDIFLKVGFQDGSKKTSEIVAPQTFKYMDRTNPILGILLDGYSNKSLPNNGLPHGQKIWKWDEVIGNESISVVATETSVEE